MAKALSIDLRERVIAAVNEGMSRREAAARFGVSASSAIRWCALERETGDARSKPQGGVRIPIHSGRVFRREAGHRSDLIPATIPI